MKPRHRFLIANRRDEEAARSHAERMAKEATEEEHRLVTVEVALRDDCPPGQMFLMYYLPRPTWLADVVLEGPDEPGGPVTAGP